MFQALLFGSNQDAGEGKMVLDESRAIACSLQVDKMGAWEGVGLALSRHMQKAVRHYQAVLPQVLVAEFLTKVGPMSVVVAYAPTEQSSMEVKDQFYTDLDCAMSLTIHGFTMVMGDLIAAISESAQGVLALTD